MKSSMLESMGATYLDLHRDLKLANVSAWQQYTIAYYGADNGGQYYLLPSASSTTFTMASRTKFLRQYFKYVRKNAVRVEASTLNASYDPVAFRNTNGKYVVVVKAVSGGSFSIAGLPAGTYGIKYTTSSQYDIDVADVAIAAGANVNTSIPAAGVITVYGK
jgi:hypothetical protein